MYDPVRQLYETRAYPAMSHPSSDPAVSAVAALFQGLQVRHPADADILEIGCGSGLNLLPLARRWPNSRFVGIDLSYDSIQQAQELAGEAGVSNIRFEVADLRNYDVGAAKFDFIMAHGFLSWVPDDVKARLFTFCEQVLTAKGIATISFNVMAGWAARFPVIQKARAILQAGAENEMAALAILRTITDTDSAELAIIDDMLAKGPGILPFDDLSPVNDPWSLEQFAMTASRHRLRWLGESEVSENHQNRSDFTLESQAALDVVTGRTFRSAMLCREDAALNLKQAIEVFVRRKSSDLTGLPRDLATAIHSMGPACVSVTQVEAAIALQDASQMVKQAIQSGVLQSRIEPVTFNPEPPPKPKLDALKMACARRRLPLVDVWHRPCGFPEHHYQVLAAMDGTRDRQSLAAFAKSVCPDLAFDPWLSHLAGRGMFA